MTLNPSRLVRVTATTPAASPSGLTKDDIAGQIVAYSVVAYVPDAPGRFGTGPQLDCDLLVVTGPRAGHRDPQWRCWSGLARQMREKCPSGATAVGRVVTGQSDRGTWWGIDAVTDDEVQQASRALHQLDAVAHADDEAVPF